jgi:hypothetical protein
MNPEISKFVCDHFYKGMVEDAWTFKSDYNKKLSAYGFFDIMVVEDLRSKGNIFVENAIVVFLLQFLCKSI